MKLPGAERVRVDETKDRFNQMHEVDNVLVVDGSSFTSASEKNPTLTILALAWRVGDQSGRRAAERAAVTASAGILGFAPCPLADELRSGRR